ncbi:uncharacterized protein H6S33_000639 [Morchella sextelata]|uniref:uncharacterized protein n=1 Tax=Morchella sextelata TaxID=1174677 RepID=UPI001D0518C1|nr:uncharacterized protein H6S33_000639 [Morchella sextelata]KAH0615003.1 hypothetical protein H6S33_000639 [Morchella sextelata]
MSGGLEKALFNLKFTAKQLNRQAIKAGKDENSEKAKIKKVRNPLAAGSRITSALAPLNYTERAII